MIQKLYESGNRPQDLDRIAALLSDGALVVYPTDTLYAIGCLALSVRAVERICRLKGIDPKKNNLSILCRDLSQAAEYARIDNVAFRLMKRNLPGPFTFILPASSKLPSIFRYRKEVGIRIPATPVLNELLSHLDTPLLSMSIPLRPDYEDPAYRTDPQLIHELWEEQVDLVIDGGIAPGEPSTIVRCTEGFPEIVRQGPTRLQD